MRMSQLIKYSKDLTNFLTAVGFTLHSIEIEKNPTTKEILKKIKYSRKIQDHEIIFDLRLESICRTKNSLISAALYRENESGLIYLPLLLDQLGIPRMTKTRLMKLSHAEARNDLKIELQQYRELLSGHLKATIEGKEWQSVYLNPQDY